MKNCEPTRVRCRGAGHRDGAARPYSRRHRLVLDGVARAAGAGAGRVAALDDELRARPGGRRRRRRSRTRRVPRSCPAAIGDRSASIVERHRPEVGRDRHRPRLAGGQRRRLGRRAVARHRRWRRDRCRRRCRRWRREAPGWALHAAHATTRRASASGRMGRGIMRQPPGRREGRWHRRGAPPRG